MTPSGHILDCSLFHFPACSQACQPTTVAPTPKPKYPTDNSFEDMSSHHLGNHITFTVLLHCIPYLLVSLLVIPVYLFISVLCRKLNHPSVHHMSISCFSFLILNFLFLSQIVSHGWNSTQYPLKDMSVCVCVCANLPWTCSPGLAFVSVSSVSHSTRLVSAPRWCCSHWSRLHAEGSLRGQPNKQSQRQSAFYLRPCMTISF